MSLDFAFVTVVAIYKYTNQEESFPSDDSDSEWEMNHNTDGSAFDVFCE